MNFAQILHECIEGQIIASGVSSSEAKRIATKAVEKVCKRTGVRQERKVLRLAVYEARVEGATPVELEIRFGISRATVFRFIKEELELRRIS